MSANYEEFCKKFNVDELMVAQTEYWKWSVRPSQCTLGAGVLSLKRPAEAMAELTTQEGADLINAIKIIETTLKKAFDFDKINYLMLMMIDYHVHYHVIPRYSKPIDFEGASFVDEGWPKPPVIFAPDASEEMLAKIRDFLRGFN